MQAKEAFPLLVDQFEVRGQACLGDYLISEPYFSAFKWTSVVQLLACGI